MNSGENSPKGTINWHIILVILGLIVALVGVWVAYAAWRHPVSPPPPEASFTDSPTHSASTPAASSDVTAPSSLDPIVDPGKSDPASPQKQKKYFLAEYQPTNYDGGNQSGSVSISGKEYNRSVLQEIETDMSIGEETIAEYTIGKNCNTFTATIGLSDSNSETSYPVLMVIRSEDREILKEKKLRYGEEQKISLDVTGVLRLSLASSTPADPGYYGEMAVWGDATVTCTGPLPLQPREE